MNNVTGGKMNKGSPTARSVRILAGPAQDELEREDFAGTAGFGTLMWPFPSKEPKEYKEPVERKYKRTKYRNLVGETMAEVSISDDKSIMRFVNVDGGVTEFYHAQECYEHVEIIDVIGDLDDLVGETIWMAEESTQIGHKPDDADMPEWEGNSGDSTTWTFYKFATVKGYVTIRWYGESNGYYSESVDVRYYHLARAQ